MFLQSNLFDYHFFLNRKDICANRYSACDTVGRQIFSQSFSYYIILLAVNSLYLGRFLSFHIGMAFLHGMCDPQKRCSVSQDNGLNVAFTVAHEIGHK